MSDNSNNEVTIDVNTDNLDDFSKLMFGEAKPIPVEAEEKTEESVEEPEEVTKDVDEDPVEPEETDEDLDEPEEEAEPKAKPEEKKEKPKSRFQERIDQLTHQNKETQRLLDEALARLNKEADKKETKPAPKEEDSAPKPDDTSEDGEEKYPLGEFDPLYIRDLTKFTIRKESEALRQEDEIKSQQAKMEEARTALHSEWAGKLSAARETYPDLIEKSNTLQSTFSNLEPQYGEYLASTIMAMDKGVDVLNYLVNNIEEARKITASGPTRATIALGRLEARFIEADEEKEIKKPKVSQAPTPPPVTTRGTGTKTSIPADTDDLDAFEKVFFQKTR